MGTSHSFGELDAKLARLASDYTDLPKTAVREASLLAKKIILAGSPSTLRNVGKNGSHLDVAYNATGGGAEAQSLVFAKGAWQIIEGPTVAHVITPRGAKGLGAGRASRTKNAASLLGAGPTLAGLNIGFGAKAVLAGQPTKSGFAAYAKHPGTHGQRPWAKGVARAREPIMRLFDAKAVAPLYRIFG